MKYSFVGTPGGVGAFSCYWKPKISCVEMVLSQVPESANSFSVLAILECRIGI